MIVIDTSVIVAILEQEPDAMSFQEAILADDRPLMSAATLVELSAVMKHRRGKEAYVLIDQLLSEFGIEVEPLTEPQALIAREAYARFGALNFGDCFAYALAKDFDTPLLFKGDDFGKTDVKRA